MIKDLNPHYDWQNEHNKEVIQNTQNYNIAYDTKNEETLAQFEQNALGGSKLYNIGTKINSPWGQNTVLEAQIGPLHQDQDIVTKEITVNPGFMLSLQKHRGREETWAVKRGTLTLISDAKILTLTTGEEITLPKGNAHCMINKHKEPVTIIETQRGFCREADNIRLLDFNNRPTVPLENKMEAVSAILYAEIHHEICEKFGCQNKPNPSLISDDFKNKIESLKE